MPRDDLPPEMDDTALLRQFAGGSDAAARRLTERLTPRVYAHAMRMLANAAEAEDVTQEAMLRLWQVAPDWRDAAQPSTWLFRVTANLCLDRLRRRPREQPLDESYEPAEETPAIESRLQDRDRADALQEALMRLPDRQRQAVVLRHLEGLGNAEIAEIMDIGIEAVESLTARGKRALGRHLAPRRKELGYQDD